MVTGIARTVAAATVPAALAGLNMVGVAARASAAARPGAGTAHPVTAYVANFPVAITITPSQASPSRQNAGGPRTGPPAVSDS